ncbi:hypothetical protein ACLIMP_20830 [Novosphingobium aerophilum]|uniref:hypothetical protein n=1 Tax=Novosphingobium aerophilum TaxID=2839843 RepID=UPI003FCF14AF
MHRNADRDSPAAKSAAESLKLYLAPGAVPLVVDQRPVLFLEASQQLHALDGSAAHIVAWLADGISLSALRRQLAGALSDEAIDALLTGWSEQGVIAAEPGLSFSAPVPPYAIQRYLPRGDDLVEIRFPDDPWGQTFAAPYAHLAAGLTPSLIAHDRVALCCIGTLSFISASLRGMLVPSANTGPGLRAALVSRALEGDTFIALHAACLLAGDEAIMLTGAPGAGKSTLAVTVAATCPALSVASDDIVLFDPRTGMIAPLPLPVTIKRGSWERLADIAPGLAASEPVLRGDGQWLRYLPLPGPVDTRWRKVSAIVDLHRGSASGNELAPNSATACLGKLLAEGFAQSGRCSAKAMAALAAMVENASTLRLHYTEAEQGARQLETLVGR